MYIDDSEEHLIRIYCLHFVFTFVCFFICKYMFVNIMPLEHKWHLNCGFTLILFTGIQFKKKKINSMYCLFGSWRKTERINSV